MKAGRRHTGTHGIWVDTLNPIICAGLKKFKEVVQGSDYGGIPGVVIGDVVTDYDMNEGLTGEQEELALKAWMGSLDKMIYAFDDDSEPDMEDYDFTYDHIKATDQPLSIRLQCTNKAEEARYTEDMGVWREKVKEGRALFARYYDGLWW